MAMLIDAESSASVSALPPMIDRLLIPCRIFTDEAQAMEFLRSAAGPLSSE